MTYMAACTGTPCDQFDAGQAQWFKIDQAGQKPGYDDQWFQADLMAGQTWTVTLPQNLAAGDYLIRHEIIGLHLADSFGGAEFYPSCTQVRVGGSGTNLPDAESLVTFPGAYNDSDPGIFVNVCLCFINENLVNLTQSFAISVGF